MKISLNWLKKYVDIPVSNEELVRLIGARLVEVEGVIDESHKYDNIYIVRVESCEKIPDTHLTLCRINVGSAPLIQVVCGAPNVHEGMLAVWIAPGAVVPASVHEDAPFVIGKRKMRGYESCGMLAGADELDFGDDHSGIVEIDPSVAKPGDLLADVFDLNDWILEIENKSLTHRPDTFGIIGFAREVAGILGEEFSGNAHIYSRAASGQPVATGGRRSSSPCQAPDSLEPNMSHCPTFPTMLAIKIANPDICQRYSAIVMEKHGEMKKKYLTWMDTVLSKSGMRPIDPIVDATNYLMLLTGQPLHAFDYDKFVKVGGEDDAKIIVRLAKKGEKLTLLDDAEIVLTENDIVITSNDKPVALAGAMGGKSTMIDDTTKSIIIESATFSLYNLRKTQMAHGIFSEAITRFTKGQPAYQTLVVAKECAEMLSEGFKVAGVSDEYPKPEKDIVVKITTDEINGLLGTDYAGSLIIETLRNVGFRITPAEDLPEITTEDEGVSPVTTGASDPCPKRDVIEIHVPEWRTDIHIKEDIIEEIGRLLGYDNITPTLPLHATASKDAMFELKRKTRETLSRLGANEVLTYSFVSKNLLEKAGLDVKKSYKITNSISPELQLVRQSIVPSLLDKAYLNEKLPVDKFAIFEMNKVYSKAWGENDEGVPNERNSLGFVIAERKNNETAFYKAKLYLVDFLKSFGVEAEFVVSKQNDERNKPFEPKRSADVMIDGRCMGVVGEFKNSVRNSFKLAPYLAGFEIDLDLLNEYATGVKKIEFRKGKTEDITITTDKTYIELLQEVQKEHSDAIITPGVIYQAKGQTTKNITFHLAY